jgi:hypothetical protein
MQEHAWVLQRALSLGLATDDQLRDARRNLGLDPSGATEDDKSQVLDWLVSHGLVRAATLEAIRKDLAHYRGQMATGPHQDSATLPGTRSQEGPDRATGNPTLDRKAWPQPATRAKAYPAPGWDRYEPLAFLGSGAMGAVYKAFDPSLHRMVALKFLYTLQTSAGTDRRTRHFLREARTQARIDHPNVAKVYEIGEVQGLLYLAIQFIEGLPLTQAPETLSLAEKVAVIEGVALGLQAVHRLGVVHRDIKPSNIMVARDEGGAPRGMLTDFGVAFAMDQENTSLHGVCSGTPAYMSPEQARGEFMDPRGDVYSLGATLYEFVSGRLPIPTGRELLKRIQTDVPLPLRRIDPRLSPDLEAIVAKCLHKDPFQRYDTAQALAQDLRRLLEGQPVQAMPPTFGYLARRWVGRNRAKAFAAVMGAVVLLSLGAFAASEWAGSRAQARFSLQFSQDVDDLEARLLQIRTLPPHDTGPEMRKILGRLAVLEEEIDRSGSKARGPGHAALGRASLALREWDAALVHFRKARDAGYRSSEAGAGLGLAMMAVARETLESLAALPDAVRETRGPEIQSSIVRPALALLEGQPRKDLVQAQILAWKGQLPQGLALLDQILERSPWMLEARRLQCELGVEDLEAKGPGEGGRDLARLEAQLARGREQARSDAWFPTALARLHLSASPRGGLSDSRLQTVLADIRLARLLDSRSPDLDRLEAKAWLLHAAFLEAAGRPATEPCARVLDLCRRTMAHEPVPEWALLFRIQALVLRAGKPDGVREAVDAYGRSFPGQAAALATWMKPRQRSERSDR